CASPSAYCPLAFW
nr:immunoglobulin heavy chain junction region [Macaca mulatta]MOV87661.1 immunoglobulin heavy chain junction region [Macaca mulatta]MOV88389.1 immunoglobulin heavy chain junction region [Macaca mulatta]MOV88856.1 immunoglobulin heavy chain junction region [Macaca mulatta]MOV89032.1 immunoglobulin heavy chain junction region [Macaca mulatta]